MDELIQELNEPRIEREKTSRDYQLSLSASNRRERSILVSIRLEREQQQRTEN